MCTAAGTREILLFFFIVSVKISHKHINVCHLGRPALSLSLSYPPSTHYWPHVHSEMQTAFPLSSAVINIHRAELEKYCMSLGSLCYELLLSCKRETQLASAT